MSLFIHQRLVTAKLMDLPWLSKDEIVRAFHAKAIW